MPGRIEIDDVSPVVSGGRFPAKAVVGEVVPVCATVWREGHEAVAATLVVRYHGSGYPQLVSGPVQPEPVPIETVVAAGPRVRPRQQSMTAGRTPDVFHGQFVPDTVGLWTFRVDGWGDPISSWRHAVTAKLLGVDPPVKQSAAVCLLAAIMGLALALALAPQGLQGAPLSAFLAVVALGLFPTALATVIVYRLMARMGPSFISVSNYLVPVFAVAL
ncbi:MAG TPA: DUF3416 domain-containing protein, partial [Mycobacterium sp.]|nr:DUF3416 domain-containing protein [Mycobacterium sp.]